MQRQTKLVIGLIFMGFVQILHAQTTILSQSMLTQQSFNTFTPVSVTGNQGWTSSSTYGAVCSGYFSGLNYANDDWLVGPAMNLSQMNNVELSFSHTRGSTAVFNVGVAEGWYQVYATANFTGDPATTQWIELTGFNQAVPTAWQFIASGALTIPEAAKSQQSRIAFRYQSSASQSATWEIKNVKVTGESGSAFKITNWNLEWLGCSTFGPTDETLQINNIATAMLAMNSDIYCIQEVSNTVSNPSIATLVSILGSDQWAGNIVPSDTGDCNQRQAIIYKKSKVQLVNSFQINSGSSSQGNSFYYNWSSGRYPAVYNVNLIAGSTLIPISLVNIHAKSEDGDAMSYTRRLGGSEALKSILDGNNYNAKKVILIGDFNDYLNGTSSSACACTVSPFQNFMDDPSHYIGITKDIIDAHWGMHPLIEHILLSDELANHYIPSSVAQEITVPSSVLDYYTTTSDHLPVSASFEFSLLGTQEQLLPMQNSYTIYPNPVKNQLNIDDSNLVNGTVAVIYDMTGRLMLTEKLHENAMDVSVLPAGIYILKIGNRSGRFAKQ